MERGEGQSAKNLIFPSGESRVIPKALILYTGKAYTWIKGERVEHTALQEVTNNTLLLDTLFFFSSKSVQHTFSPQHNFEQVGK